MTALLVEDELAWAEAIDQLVLPTYDEPVVDTEDQPVVNLTPKQERKRDTGGILRVRDSEDTDGDMIFHLHMETYDRRVIDDLAERYNLNLIFVMEYRDYERETNGWLLPTPDDA